MQQSQPQIATRSRKPQPQLQSHNSPQSHRTADRIRSRRHLQPQSHTPGSRSHIPSRNRALLRSRIRTAAANAPKPEGHDQHGH